MNNLDLLEQIEKLEQENSKLKNMISELEIISISSAINDWTELIVYRSSENNTLVELSWTEEEKLDPGNESYYQQNGFRRDVLGKLING